MTLVLHGGMLTLAWFLAINLAASALVLMIANRAAGPRSAGFWFGLRVLPLVSAAAFSLLVFVPAYWQHEPRNATEGFGVALIASALAAVALLAAGAIRGAAAWWRAARRTRQWMNGARRLRVLDSSSSEGLPIFAIDAEAPMMALVGLVRPRLLVTRGLLDALTAEELAASVAHEIGHHRTLDNLKRLIMRAAPDLLAPTAVARAIERRWASAAEHVADRMTGHATPATRCALASALVKVARLTPRHPNAAAALGTPPPHPLASEPISTLVGGGDITSRVRALLADRSPEPVASRHSRTWMYATIALATFAVMYGSVLHTVHDVTELVVHILP